MVESIVGALVLLLATAAATTPRIINLVCVPNESVGEINCRCKVERTRFSSTNQNLFQFCATD